jgi:protein arginine kinase activator
VDLMLCQKCGQKFANIHIKRRVDNKEIELHLCEECAKEMNSIVFIKKNNDNMGDFAIPINILTSLFNKGVEYSPQPKNIRKCKFCGMTYDMFTKNGKCGCASCYKEFEDVLENALNRIHGSDYHKGKIPKNVDLSVKTKRRIENLKDELAKMIKDEKYEEAAKIRDNIKELEKGLEGEEKNE